MNIMLNNYCNLSCPWCFASVNKNEKRDITMENFMRYLQVITNSRINFKRVGILGGEPTISPNFEKFVLLSYLQPNINSVMIFTNGTCIDFDLKSVCNSKTGFLINLNNPKLIGFDKYNNIINNIASLKDAYLANGIDPAERITLGINMYDYNIDYDYIISAIKLLGFNKVRYSIIIPTNNEINEMKYFDRMRKFIPRLMDFLDACYTNRIMSNIDCNNIAKCLFTKDQLMTLINQGHNLMHKNICHPVLDVDIDLNVRRCFPIDIGSVNLKDYDTIEDLNKHFSCIDNKCRSLPLMDECEGCKQFCDKTCQPICHSQRNILSTIRI